MTQYGIIGVGNMGLPMAKNILAAGLPLYVYDVCPEGPKELARRGASVAQSAAEVASRSDIIAVIVVDEVQLEQVVNGPDGLLAGAVPGSVIVIHSTVSPAVCQKLNAQASALAVEVVDAPISGGEGAAREGALTLIVGGAPAAVERCHAMFDAVGSTVVHVGDTGSGQIAKIVNNQIALVVNQATRDGLRLARAAGIDEELMLEVLMASTADSWAARHWEATRWQIGQYPSGPRGVAELAYKDLQLATALGHEYGIRLPLAALASQFVYDMIEG